MLLVSSERHCLSALQVEYNVADSGVQPVRLDELLTGPEAQARLLRTELHYPAVGGPPTLRRLIADWQGAAPHDVLVTCGAAEVSPPPSPTPTHTHLTIPGTQALANGVHRILCFPVHADDYHALQGSKLCPSQIRVTNAMSHWELKSFA